MCYYDLVTYRILLKTLPDAFRPARRRPTARCVIGQRDLRSNIGVIINIRQSRRVQRVSESRNLEEISRRNVHYDPRGTEHVIPVVERTVEAQSVASPPAGAAGRCASRRPFRIEVDIGKGKTPHDRSDRALWSPARGRGEWPVCPRQVRGNAGRGSSTLAPKAAQSMTFCRLSPKASERAKSVPRWFLKSGGKPHYQS